MFNLGPVGDTCMCFVMLMVFYDMTAYIELDIDEKVSK